jgi:hypothetical protein
MSNKRTRFIVDEQGQIIDYESDVGKPLRPLPQFTLPVFNPEFLQRKEEERLKEIGRQLNLKYGKQTATLGGILFVLGLFIWDAAHGSIMYKIGAIVLFIIGGMLAVGGYLMHIDGGGVP